MQYIYLNNVRGFNRTLVPIRPCTFLVGENSTGKSSFLSILRVLSRPDFFFNPRFSFGDENSVIGFADIVSAWAIDKTYFDVGIVNLSKHKSGKIDISFTTLRFGEKNGNPVLIGTIQRRDRLETNLWFGPKTTEYVRTIHEAPPKSDEDAITQFWASADILGCAQSAAKRFPKEIPPYPPLGIAMSILSTLESGETPRPQEFKFEIAMGMNLTWIAPIRTKPQRIYDGLSRDYSAEGEHSPFILKQNLKSKRFAEQLAEFGNASGLFEAVSTHTFGKGKRNPFEVLIKFKGAELNVDNVGYGVSQALPLVIEFLAREQGRRFAVQQPEVHLHPKAQAALGSLIFQIAKERKQAFLIETHSDFLIDRYRLEMATSDAPPEAQVLFFSRTGTGNSVTPLVIGPKGQYPGDQPSAFRDFFIREEMRLISL